MAEEEDEAPGSCLDVSSESFNPLLALYSPQTPLPFPDIRCFNNLAEYESFLRGGARGRARGAQRGQSRGPGGKRKGRKPEPDPERIERLKQLMLPVEEGKVPVRPRRSRAPKNVLTRMPLHAGSPLGELNRCVQDRIRIRVHIRTFKGLRGVCSGFIVAFDKFWNMAMVDVDETYRKPVLGKAFYNEPQLTLTRLFDRLQLQEPGSHDPAKGRPAGPAETLTAPPSKKSTQPSERAAGPPVEPGPQGHSGNRPKQRRRNRKEKVDYQQVFTRHLKQIFIRGENVLLVHIAE
ncbi:U7 snRNA-associated Sm-like protein LSm11 [Xenopus laevis]|uniref:U7 snRNA-associated Sm-like protein LSm11 n=2 Tax=Xenopus laevis TaxID=8355 RepID=LSM11_XENLA|nr:U7 snRNA-associated Sm-like protein LSm11 [Xenopus laevis]Q7T076.1 RecName: Full=U7 snRNA-associated Sm-like protein LSm11 [Xenopus laevis]AAQ08119.1 U7 snRNA-associated Sm-like protein Lsm11 [Xenopus laevis]OCT86263.1 hypothetical protein XELAEV_18019955mg [Xenopus laevis]